VPDDVESASDTPFKLRAISLYPKWDGLARNVFGELVAVLPLAFGLFEQFLVERLRLLVPAVLPSVFSGIVAVGAVVLDSIEFDVEPILLVNGVDNSVLLSTLGTTILPSTRGAILWDETVVAL
jgi:hypothetical protein